MKPDAPRKNSESTGPPQYVYTDSVEEYFNVKRPQRESRMEFEELIRLITDSNDDRCVRFESAEGGHFVKQADEGDITAVYAGPNGPENRPASIDHENLWRLFEHSERIDLVPTTDSPFDHVAIRTSQSSENG